MNTTRANKQHKIANAARNLATKYLGRGRQVVPGDGSAFAYGEVGSVMGKVLATAGFKPSYNVQTDADAVATFLEVPTTYFTKAVKNSIQEIAVANLELYGTEQRQALAKGLIAFAAAIRNAHLAKRNAYTVNAVSTGY